MSKPKIAPYGSWKSPITSALIVAEMIGLNAITLDEEIYWLELRPKEGGRLVLVQGTSDGKTTVLTPEQFNVRTRVHEYGGGSYAVARGTVFFSNFLDQRLYRQEPSGSPSPITPKCAFRYADYVVDEGRNLLFCVREDHSGQHEAVNAIVKVKCQGDEAGGEAIVFGNDFYSSPRLSPDGSKLAWLTWNHPNMPWDGTELWVGDVKADGTIGHKERVAGGVTESLVQPEWSPAGVLYFISDRTNWWNIYRWQGGRVEPLCLMPAEFGKPHWLFGQSNYAFESAGRIICTYSQQGKSHVASLDTSTLILKEIETPYTVIQSVRAEPGRVLLIAGSSTETASIVSLDLASHHCEVLRRSSDLEVDPDYISIPQAIEFPTEGELTAHAFFYSPYNRNYVASEGALPPLLVVSHGGPTAATSAIFNIQIQYWTSRGIAVLDVNYGGSTGYGRAFRERLNGQWGVVDVDDCINAARHLVNRGEVDDNRLAIAGGSAGGYTTLSALTFRDDFSAGASYYGVADLETLAGDTHKFESRYLDSLIGPYPAMRDLYIERSPIHHIELLDCPLILFQGLADEVVPPNQAEKMFEAVRAKGLPVSYLPFEGEQHGFRKAENIMRSLDAELYFYSIIFDFELADPVEPVPIENL